jgi:hypothetical protein
MTRVHARPAACLQRTHTTNVSTMEVTAKGRVACLALYWDSAFLLVVRLPQLHVMCVASSTLCSNEKRCHI